MRLFVRIGWSALATLALATAAHAQTQVKAQVAPGAAPAATAPTVVVRPTNPGQILATVNGEKITKAELLDLVKRYDIPTNDLERVYRDGIETLVNVKLLNQFLARQKLPVSDKQIDDDLEQIKKQLKENGQDLATALVESGNTMDDVRKQLASRRQWVEYVDQKATPAELKNFVARHHDLFSGTQVRASHILLKVAEDAPEAEKEKVRQRLLEIKKEIESNKLTFAQAANKYSQDDNKAQGDGGDIGYFTRSSGYIEEFVDAAFKMKKGQISDPVETLLGYHLILVTDRKEGTARFDEQAQRPLVIRVYSTELQKNIIAAARKNAKIDVKPMPADLFATIQPSPDAKGSDAGKAATPKAR